MNRHKTARALAPGIALLLAVAIPLAVPPAAQTVPPPPPPAAREDPAVTVLARKIYSQMRAGKVDDALLTLEMQKTLTPDALAQTRPPMAQLGDPIRITLESSAPADRSTRWVYLAVFAAAQLHVTILVTKDGKVGGYTLAL